MRTLAAWETHALMKKADQVAERRDCETCPAKCPEGTTKHLLPCGCKIYHVLAEQARHDAAQAGIGEQG